MREGLRFPASSSLYFLVCSAVFLAGAQPRCGHQNKSMLETATEYLRSSPSASASACCAALYVSAAHTPLYCLGLLDGQLVRPRESSPIHADGLFFIRYASLTTICRSVGCLALPLPLPPQRMLLHLLGVLKLVLTAPVRNRVAFVLANAPPALLIWLPVILLNHHSSRYQAGDINNTVGRHRPTT